MSYQYQLNPERRELTMLTNPKIFVLSQNAEGIPYLKLVSFRAELINDSGMFPSSTFIWFEICYRPDIDSFYIKRYETRYDERNNVTFDGVYARNRAKASEDGKFMLYKRGRVVASYTVEEILALPTVSSENLVGYTNEVRETLLKEAKNILYKNNFRVSSDEVIDVRSSEKKAQSPLTLEMIEAAKDAINHFVIGRRMAKGNNSVQSTNTTEEKGEEAIEDIENVENA